MSNATVHLTSVHHISLPFLVGYIRLREDVYASTNDLKNRLQAAHADTSVLLARMQAVENRVTNIEENKVLSSPVVAAVSLPVVEDSSASAQ